MSTAVILPAGTELGGYRVEEVIGIGGMAVVYRARQVSLGRAVALKVLAVQHARDPAFRERFRLEALHVAALDHPHIVPIYDAGDEDGTAYIAMRLVVGGTLADRLADGPLPSAETVRVLRAVASALDAALRPTDGHASGLVHRDVKPQNVLLTPDGHPYLTDFGVATSGGSSGLTATGTFVGSINFASPEQIRGTPVSGASDRYSLAAVLHQCVTGRVPYPRESDAGVMHAHLVEEPPRLPAALAALQPCIDRGMAKDPGQRHPSAAALVDEAEAVLRAIGARKAPAAAPLVPKTATPVASDESPVARAAGPESRAPTTSSPVPMTSPPGREGIRAAPVGPPPVATSDSRASAAPAPEPAVRAADVPPADVPAADVPPPAVGWRAAGPETPGTGKAKPSKGPGTAEAPDRPPASAVRRGQVARYRWVAAGAVVAGAAVGGGLLVRPDAPAAARALPVATGGVLSVAYDDRWEPRSPVGQVAGVRLVDGATLRATGSGDGAGRLRPRRRDPVGEALAGPGLRVGHGLPAPA
ncbi:protein kinase, partial [Patulibacter sp. NPDC049589]|uniref:serine/threonine-protein kinase n=1 Tax=Patulibacter sp. NPDC049589 TaxID=3154731 RepID=UPI003422118F